LQLQANDANPSYVAFDFWHAHLTGNISLVPVSLSSPLVLPASPDQGPLIHFHYYVVAPVLGNFVLLGEVDKMVVGCRRRFSELSATGDALQAGVRAAPGEDVHLGVVLPAQLQVLSQEHSEASAVFVTCASKQCGSDECVSKLVCSTTACTCE
jgi:hypothetical protein